MSQSPLYVEVIVDIPASPTDRPFDYLVPTKWQSDVVIGSRVQVSFGPQKRLGYVVRIKKESSVKRVREINGLMDAVPPLTPELIRLGEWISDQYLCHRITALHAMLPAVLKGKYRKRLSLTKQAQREDFSLYPELFHRLQEKKSMEWEEVLQFPQVTISRLREKIRQGLLDLQEQVGDRATQQKVWIVSPPSTEVLAASLDEIPKRNKKQREILRFFVDHPRAIPLPELLLQLSTSRPIVQKCVENGWLSWEEREEKRDPFKGQRFASSEPMQLTAEQTLAYQRIIETSASSKNETILLHGVTGSGKTEIYLQSIAKALQQGKETIVLVPEISLTPQMVERFKGRFGEQVAVLHSALSKGEKYDEWRKVRDGQCKVVIGARSAIFAPFSQLGLIIIDEEHESSYKQEDHPKYHTRAVAEWRARENGATLVLGSATPAVESYYLARSGEYQYIQLTERVKGRAFPAIQLVDMRTEMQQGNRSMFSQALQEELVACVQRGEQAVLFLNRRGFSTFVMCRECGESVQCPHCDITLTYHRSNDTLRCHYCGYTARLVQECPHCESTHIRHFGTGTQKVEDELMRSFPQIRVIRMDVDTTSRKGSHQRLLSKFGKGEADVLLGTQMIAKGLDFPHVTLVGVLAADTMLHLPDFRAAERTYQLLTQVSGRAGRHEQPGKVVIQTYQTDHFSIQMVRNQQSEAFYRHECLTRKKVLYPPFCGLFHILLSHPDRVMLLQKGQQIVTLMRNHLSSACQILGPVPAVIPRLKDLYRLQILLKFPEDSALVEQVKLICNQIIKDNQEKELRISVDRDGKIHDQPVLHGIER